jgi:hypothetical protein
VSGSTGSAYVPGDIQISTNTHMYYPSICRCGHDEADHEPWEDIDDIAKCKYTSLDGECACLNFEYDHRGDVQVTHMVAWYCLYDGVEYGNVIAGHDKSIQDDKHKAQVLRMAERWMEKNTTWRKQ